VIADYCDTPTCKPKCQVQSNGNLVPNAGFDRVNWVYGGSLEFASQTFWQSTDATGCENSGSVQIGSMGSILSDCFPVQSGLNYFFGFMFRAVNFDPAFQNCGVAWFTDGSCTNGTAPNSGTNPMPGSGWQKTPSTGLTAPATALSALIFCANGKDFGFEVDRFYFNATAPAF
jgi:hypothetical protein